MMPAGYPTTLRISLSLSLSAFSVEMSHLYETPSWHAAGKHVEQSLELLASSCFRAFLATTVCSTHQHVVLCDHQTEEAAEACQSEQANKR